MAARRYRWTCPACGVGRMLGARPRKDATARFCIPCSEETGSLVGLVCPAQDRRRSDAKTKARGRAAKDRSSVRDAETFGGVHVPSEYRILWKLARKIEPTLSQSPPRLTTRSGTGYYSSGRCWWNDRYGLGGRAYRIHITAGSYGTDVRFVLAHEIAHAIAAVRGGFHHDEIFRVAEAEILQDSGLWDYANNEGRRT